MKRMKKMIVYVMVTFLLGFFGFGSATAVPKYGGTFTMVIGTNPDTLDSDQTRMSEAGMVVVENVVQGLARLNENMEVVPCLAKSWKAFDGGKVWEFYLQKGVKFHDGSEFDAEVVKWNFERGFDPKIGWSGRPIYEEVIESYEAVDKYTFRINLKKKMGAFMETAFLWVTRGKLMQSRKAVEKWGKDYGRHPVGTGPLKFAEWVDYDHITLVRNENYWEKGLPYVDKVIFKVVSDVNVRLQALRAGEIDLMRDLPAELLPLVKGNPKLKYVLSKPVNVESLMFNLKKKPWDDKRVSQAIGFAINRQEIVDLLLRDQAIADANFVPNENYFYHDVGFFKHDPQRAKELLKEAGYEKLSFELLTNTCYPRFVKEAELIKEQLAKVGIEANIKVLDKNAWVKALFSGAFEVTLEDWESASDPSEYIGIWLISTSRYNAFGYNNPEFDKLMSEGLLPVDPAQRKVIYDKAQNLAVKDAPHIVILHKRENAAMQKYVMGCEKIPIASSFMCGYYIWLDK